MLIILPSIIASYCCLFWKAKKIAKKDVVSAFGDENSFKKEWRTTITFCLMFVVLFILIAPFFIWLLVFRIIAVNIETPEWLSVFDGVIFNFVTLLVVMDPIFLMRNRDVRDVLSGISWMPKCLV